MDIVFATGLARSGAAVSSPMFHRKVRQMPGQSDYNTRHPMDWDALDAEGSEFSWGSGLEPGGLSGAPPSEGGRYRGTSPPCEKRIG